MQIQELETMARSLLVQGHVECDYIEYKKSLINKAGILKTACAYASNYMNREIGLIFIGVEEVNDADGRKAVPVRPITGIDPALWETTENEIKSLLAEIHPRITYHLLDIAIDGASCIVIAVEPGMDGPYETSRRAENDKGIRLPAGRYIRVRRDTRFPNKREEFELLKKFADFHFSSELNETATLDDLNYEWMREYLVRTNAQQDVRDLPKLEMAQSMGLISGSEYGGYRAKNFAVLMFADRPQDFISYARVEIIREVRDTDRMEATIFDGPIWIQIEQAKRFFKEVIQRSYTVRPAPAPANHRIVYNWPEATFSELLTNAVLHKEYDKPQYIGVYVYEDSLSFINHNRPLPPVTIEDLNNHVEFRDRNYINPQIKEMFFALDLIESYGSGVRRAKRAMEENGNPSLYFEPTNDTDDYTMVTCPINEEFAYIRDHEDLATRKTTSNVQEAAEETTPIEVSTTPILPAKISNSSNLTTPKRRLSEADDTEKDTAHRILSLIALNPLMSASDMADTLGLTRDGVRYHLKKMTAEGIVAHEGPARSGRWLILKGGNNGTQED